MKLLYNFGKAGITNTIIVILSALLGYGSSFASDISKIGYKNISAKEAMIVINTSQNVVILDVSDSKDYDVQHLTGSLSIPLSELVNKMQDIDVNSTLVVYSQNGEKSKQACKVLWEMGYKNLYNVEKGIVGFLEAKIPLIPSKQPNEFSGRPLVPDNGAFKSEKSTSAPGYCTSYGGSTSYEYISSATYDVLASNALALTVIIAINNPSGCTYGQPCPSYDDSPEYINGWIDWNGNKEFEESERVLNAALSGYVGINYYGTMSTSTVVSIPDSIVGSTWMRVNLGWGYDPNDPCSSSWSWGNVVDVPIEISVTPPEIKEIEITGIPHENGPITNDPSLAGTEKVKLEADIEENPDYEITEIRWTGDIQSGSGNPYEYIPSAGAHGNKNVICTISYKHKSSGIVGTDNMNKRFKLFFNKATDDDGNNEPNWFKYWKSDGAVPDMAPAKYDRTSGAYGYMVTATGELYLTPHSAGVHYNNPIVLTTNLGTESFGGPTVKGIDCTAEVVGHENYHKWVNNQWLAGGSFVGKTDTDNGLQSADCNDKLPNFYEKATSHTDTTDTDTYDLEHKKSATYRKYGDNEYMAMRTGDSKRGTVAKDWAYPGKQSDPVYKIDFAENASAYEPVYASFTGNYSDAGVDNNTDGTFEYLKVMPEINVTAPGIFSLVAILNDASLNMVSVFNEQISLELGIQSLNIEFEGLDINEHGIDGPYTVTYLLTNEFGDELDFKYNVHTTAAYNFSDFIGKNANFSNTFSDYGTDYGYDGMYDSLTIQIGVNIIEAGVYLIEGGLYDDEANVIELKASNITLSAGDNTVALNFDGLLINQKRLNGPYYLRYLAISKDGVADDFIYDAHTTSAYYYTEFQTTQARFNDSFSDYGTDTDIDGLFNILNIGIGINVLSDGNYTLIGSLYDSLDVLILKTEKVSYLYYGNKTINLEFDGETIHNHGIDGPFYLKDLSVINEDGELMDVLSSAYTTNAYEYTNFQSYSSALVSLAGSYTEYLMDADTNCVYDYLSIKADITIADSGYVIIKAKLEDAYGQEIVWAENMAFMKLDTIHVITLHFDGEAIYNHGVDGPYYLKNVYIYHTGDPTKSDYVANAYTTQVYRYAHFDDLPGIQPNFLGNDTTINTTQTLLIDAGAGFESYVWSNGATSQSILIDNSMGVGEHTFSVIVTDFYGCIGYDTINATIEDATNIIVINNDLSILKLFPNPSSGLLNIQIENIKDHIEIQIIAETGQSVFSKIYTANENQMTERLDLSNFSSGIYFIKVINDNKIQIEKFVLQK